MDSSLDAKPASPRPRRRWLQFSLRGLLVLVTVVAVALAVYGRRDPPPDFDWQKLEASATKYLQVTYPKSADVEVRLLAWHIMEHDNKRVRLANAFIWTRLEAADGTPQWSLMQLFGRADRAVWECQQDDYEGERTFGHPPSKAEVDDFLSRRSYWWNLKPDDEWSILAGDVLDKAWTDAIGERPTQFYPEGIER